MKLAELKEIIDNDMEFFSDAEVIITIATTGGNKIHRELDTTLVDGWGEFYFLTDAQREWKTKKFWEVKLWD